MKLIISIDTEEDNWGQFTPHGHTTDNIKQIPKIQSLFDEFNVKPTYLISYPVAVDDNAIKILTEIADDNNCEIGAHCHPWNTPPFKEATGSINSMLCNLPSNLQYDKLRTLHKTIENNYCITPRSFRSGRWGIGDSTFEHLIKLGYIVDSSITPYVSWEDYFGPDFSKTPNTPFRINSNKRSKQGNAPSILEVPASVGYLNKYFELCNRVHIILRSQHIKKLHLIGILYRLGLMQRVKLSPEEQTANEMIALTKVMHAKGFKYANMFFHSPSLKAGNNSYVKNGREEIVFYTKIRQYLEYINDAGIDSITLSETHDIESRLAVTTTRK